GGSVEGDAVAFPAVPSVEDHRRPMQRIEHFALTILWSRLHRSTRHAIPRELPAHPISSLQPPMSNAASRWPRAGVSSRWPATTSKTCAGARGLALRHFALVPRLRR